MSGEKEGSYRSLAGARRETQREGGYGEGIAEKMGSKIFLSGWPRAQPIIGQ